MTLTTNTHTSMRDPNKGQSVGRRYHIIRTQYNADEKQYKSWVKDTLKCGHHLLTSSADVETKEGRTEHLEFVFAQFRANFSDTLDGSPKHFGATDTEQADATVNEDRRLDNGYIDESASAEASAPEIVTEETDDEGVDSPDEQEDE